ncbi:MAG: valine--tRNA ligase, partial [Okeania sp. SIO2H7]|nr:valine--tRNA ligase [Okeania sp. SIO2H7]
ILDLAKVEKLTITDKVAAEVGKTIAGVYGTVQALIPLEGVVDIEALRARLEKKLAKIEGQIQSLSGRLNNPKFVNKADPKVVQEVRDNLAEAEKQAEILRDRLKRF